jgi:hypothetical protein
LIGMLDLMSVGRRRASTLSWRYFPAVRVSTSIPLPSAYVQGSYLSS